MMQKKKQVEKQQAVSITITAHDGNMYDVDKLLAMASGMVEGKKLMRTTHIRFFEDKTIEVTHNVNA